MFQCTGGTPHSCRAGQASLGIRFELLAEWHPQLQLPFTPPKTCDLWSLNSVQMRTTELHSNGPFINHEAPVLPYREVDTVVDSNDQETSGVIENREHGR